MDRRIAVPGTAELKAALERLTAPLDSVGVPLFETKQKALMFASALGRMRGADLELKQRDTGSAVRFDIFQTAMDDAYLSALAISTDGSLKILDSSREEEIITIFERYAHGGLVEMNRKCFDSGLDPLDALLSLTLEVADGEIEDLPGLDPSVLRDLMRG